jgi:hypothetical protein
VVFIDTKAAEQPDIILKAGSISALAGMKVPGSSAPARTAEQAAAEGQTGYLFSYKKGDNDNETWMVQKFTNLPAITAKEIAAKFPAMGATPTTECQQWEIKDGKQVCTQVQTTPAGQAFNSKNPFGLPIDSFAEWDVYTKGFDKDGVPLAVGANINIKSGTISVDVNGHPVASIDVGSTLKKVVSKWLSQPIVQAAEVVGEDVWKDLEPFMKTASPYLKTLLQGWMRGDSTEEFAKSLAKVALTTECEAVTAATGNALIAGAGLLGCAYLMGWLTDKVWPDIKEGLKWLSDNVPGAKELFSAITQAYNGGKQAVGWAEKEGNKFLDTIGFYG